MTDSTPIPIARWVRRGVAFALAALLLSSAVSLAAAFLSRPVSELAAPAVSNAPRLLGEPATDVSSPPVGMPSITKAVLTVTDDTDGIDHSVFATWDVLVPRDHPMLEEARRLDAGEITALVDRMLARVRVNNLPFAYDEPSFRIDPEGDDAQLILTGGQDTNGTSVFVEVLPPIGADAVPVADERIVVKLSKSRMGFSPTPLSQSDDEVVFRREPHQSLTFELQFPPAPDTTTAPRGAFRIVAENIFAYSTFRAVALIPTVLVLLLVHRHSRALADVSSRLRVLASVAVVILCADLLVSVVNTITNETGNLGRLYAWSAARLGIARVPFVSNQGAFLLTLGMAAVVWPLVLRRRNEDGAGEHARAALRKRAAPWVASAILLALWVIGHLALMDEVGQLDITPGRADLIYAAGTLPLLIVASYILLRTMREQRGLWWKSVVLAVVLGALAALESVPEIELSTAAQAAMLLLCGVPLLVAFINFVLRHAPSPLVPARRRVRQVAVVIAAILLLPVLRSEDLYTPRAIDIWNILPDLARFLSFCLLAVIVDWMSREEPNTTWPSSSPPALAAGLAITVAFFFSTGIWYMVLVQVLVGYVLIRYVLFAEPSVPDDYLVVSSQRVPLIHDMIRSNDLHRAAKALKKEMLSKLAKGDITYLTYASKVEPVQEEALRAERRITRHGVSGRATVLAFGPGATPWENARVLVPFGIVFALPWMLLAFRDLLPPAAALANNRAGANWHGLLPALISAMNITARWLLLPFLFGYFYPYLRGSNGIQKALWVAVTIIAPSTVATALFAGVDRGSWLGLAFWALQLFSTSVLLGLVAGDLQTLRRAGFRWRHLVEVHNLGAIAAWSYGVVLAIGTAATTLLSTQFVNLAVDFLGYAGVLPSAPRR